MGNIGRQLRTGLAHGPAFEPLADLVQEDDHGAIFKDIQV